jgi:hypothetical protein
MLAFLLLMQVPKQLGLQGRDLFAGGPYKRGPIRIQAYVSTVTCFLGCMRTAGVCSGSAKGQL